MGMRAGMSEVVITPPVGVRLAGYAARTGASTSVLDDLYAKAMVLECDGRSVALVVCDLLGLGRPMVSAIRAKVRELTGLEERSVMVTATHTHCGPDLSCLSESSLDHLVEQVAGAVWCAKGALTEVELGIAQGESSIGVNRRNPDSPNAPYFLYSYPEGTMDRRLLLLELQTPEGRKLGAVLNYPCHGVTLGSRELGISKDFVEWSCRVLKAAWGASAVPIFLQGCAANVNPRWIYDRPELRPMPPPAWPRSLEARLRETKRLGHALGGAALAAAGDITSRVSSAPLDSRLREVRLPLRSELPPYLAKPSAGVESSKYPDLRSRLHDDRSSIETEVQVLRVGDSYIVGLPGEVFVEHQITLRSTADVPALFVSELAGDSIGYIMTPETLAEGGYEPSVCCVTADAGSLLTRAALEAIREMR